MKKIVLFDLDNVLLKGQSQKLFVKYLFMKRKVSFFLKLRIYLWFFLYKIGLSQDIEAFRKYAFNKIFLGWKKDDLKNYCNSFCHEVLVDRFG